MVPHEGVELDTGMFDRLAERRLCGVFSRGGAVSLDVEDAEVTSREVHGVALGCLRSCRCGSAWRRCEGRFWCRGAVGGDDPVFDVGADGLEELLVCEAGLASMIQGALHRVQAVQGHVERCRCTPDHAAEERLVVGVSVLDEFLSIVGVEPACEGGQ